MGLLSSIFGSSPKQVGPSMEEVMAQAVPWGVSAAGIGGTTVDKEGRVISTTIDPQMQALADMFRQRMGMQTAAISGYDPTQAAQEYYQQYVAPDLMQQQEQERLALENRLLSQGMLGATGGALRMGELARAQSAEQRAGRAGAFTQAQDLLTQMRQREAADLAAMAGIYEAPIGLMSTGAGIGQSMGQIAGAYQPTYTKGSSGLLGGLASGVASGMGSTLGQYAAGLMIGSDIRLKKNVKKADKKNGIQFYTWEWNDKAKELGLDWGPTFGVMAQEIKNIIPEAVLMGTDGYYRVDYSKVV